MQEKSAGKFPALNKYEFYNIFICLFCFNTNKTNTVAPNHYTLHGRSCLFGRLMNSKRKIRRKMPLKTK